MPKVHHLKLHAGLKKGFTSGSLEDSSIGECPLERESLHFQVDDLFGVLIPRRASRHRIYRHKYFQREKKHNGGTCGMSIGASVVRCSGLEISSES
jgi:hypothetical protein